jgi:hypothetical protein
VAVTYGASHRRNLDAIFSVRGGKFRVCRGFLNPLEAISSPLVFGVASLPLGSPVELEVIFEVTA